MAEVLQAQERRQEAVEGLGSGGGGEERKKVVAVVVEVPYVGGIRRRERKVLAEGVALCRHCDGKAAFVDYDNVLEVFDMPLWRWPGRNPALVCSQCGQWLWTSHFEPLPTPAITLDSDDVIHPPSSSHPPAREPGSQHCWSCSLVCHPLFKFCPSCGSRQDFW